MVMGQEERKNKAKLEKTQISLASSNAEYEAAVKALEDTTARWNREWKAAADKFQDLEEERLDFTKSSLWTFANIASTVCVSDDASCEKIRLSLEKMDVEKDIIHFINEKGTGQEIPDPPKYINFCRGDVDDHRSEVSEEDNYSVAQFPRSINPAFRTSSPQPSTYESHHDPNSALARDLGHQEPVVPLQLEQSIPPQNARPQPILPQNSHPQAIPPHNGGSHIVPSHNGHPQAIPPQNPHHQVMPQHGGHHQAMSQYNEYAQAAPSQMRHPQNLPPQDRIPSQERRAIHSMQQYDASQFSAVPHDPYPMDGMTMLCRTDGMNPGRNMNVASRYDGPKSATAQSMPPPAPAASASEPPNPSPSSNAYPPARQEEPNTAETTIAPAIAPARIESARPTAKLTHRFANSTLVITPGVSARYEAPKPASTSSALTRPDPVPATTANSNPPARYEPINSATSSNISSNISTADDNSEYSNPTSFSSQEPPSSKVSPVKVEEPAPAPEPEKRVFKKKSGFFQNHSPFRRKSTKDPQTISKNRNTWGPVASQASTSTPSTTFTTTPPVTIATATPRRPQLFKSETQTQNMITDRTASPEAIDADASLALNVGQNVFPVANTDKRKQSVDQEAPAQEEQDPIALALAELKGAVENKQSTNRVSADRYHGISTPVPDRGQERAQEPAPDRAQERAQSRAQERAQNRAQSRAQSRAQERPQERPQERTQERKSVFSQPVPAPRASADTSSGLRGTPPPSYDTPVQRLGVPPPAVTSKAMQEASRKFTGQARQTAAPSRPASVYNNAPAPSRPATRHSEVPRAASPAPPRSVSPRPSVRPETRQAQRSASPNPYGGSQPRHSPQPSVSSNRGSMDQGYYRQNSPADVHSRTASPAPYRNDYDRPVSRGGAAMAVQLAPVGLGGEGSIYGSVRSRGSSGRPGTSSSSRAMSFYEGRDPSAQDRQRSRSVADPSRQYTPEGRAILHYG